MSLHALKTHPVYVEGCFGCKAATLNLDTGHIRAWAQGQERELSSYKDARKYGIQPRSTKQHDVTAAVRASDKVGSAVVVR